MILTSWTHMICSWYSTSNVYSQHLHTLPSSQFIPTILNSFSNSHSLQLCTRITNLISPLIYQFYNFMDSLVLVCIYGTFAIFIKLDKRLCEEITLHNSTQVNVWSNIYPNCMIYEKRHIQTCYIQFQNLPN